MLVLVFLFLFFACGDCGIVRFAADIHCIVSIPTQKAHAFIRVCVCVTVSSWAVLVYLAQHLT